MSEPSVIQSNFEAGAFIGVAGYLIPENGAARIENGMLNEEGLVYKRGGATYHSDADFGATGLTFLWEGFIGGERKTLFANSADFGVLDLDDESPINIGGPGLVGPTQCALMNDYLFIGGGYIWGGARKGNSIGTGTIDNGESVIVAGGGVDETDVDVGTLVLIENSDQVYRIIEMDGTDFTLDRPYVGANVSGVQVFYLGIYSITGDDVYPDSDMYAVCADRLIAVREGNELVFSNRTDPHTWGDNDFHETPEGAIITGLGVIGQETILFTTSGVWTLSGLAFNIVSTNGDPQHRLAVLSRDIILWEGVGITTWEQALVVPAVDGVWILDGQGAPARISQPIEGLYHRYVRLGYRPGAGCVYHGHLFLPILSGGLNPKGTFVCRLDRPSLPWVQLSGQGANTVSYIHRTNEGIGSRETTLLAAERAATSRVLNCSTFFEPNADVKNDPDGSTPVFVLETRTYATGGGTKNVVRHLRTRYDMVASVADDSDVDISWASDGVLINNAKWNQVKWNQFKWGSNAARWNALTCSLRQGVDRSPRCRVGKRQRYIKFRYHNADPVASLSIKEIVLFIRPSRAVRV